jgi:asparagine synthase (glutamine-hydrolysing)
MGAIFGIIGEGSLDEVRAMGRQVLHRGEWQQVWSPLPDVFLGQASRRPVEICDSCPIATDWHLTGGETSPARLGRVTARRLASLRGSFSLAACEAEGGVVLAVDQLGYKSLFYAELPGRLVFASEYKALLALPDLPLEPDRGAIQHYLATKQPLSGRSFLARVRSLSGGHMLHWRDGRATIQSYWAPSIDLVERTPQEHAAVLQDALLGTVRQQVHTYEHVGVTLGGGLDAAIVLGAIRHVAPDVRVSSFTIGASSDDWELVGARETSEAFGTEHHEYTFDPSVIPSELPRLVWLAEDCGGREEAMLQMQVLRAAGTQTSTVFGGHGADVLFGGMPRHRLVGLAERLPFLRGPLEELFQLSQAGVRPETNLGRGLALVAYGRSQPPAPLRVVGGGAPQTVPWRPELNQFIQVTMQRMNSLNYLEPQHELAGATFHSPFLDPDLIGTSLTVPGRLKSGWWQQKLVLRTAAAELLPATIRRRKKAIQRAAQGPLGGVLAEIAGDWLPDSAIEQHGLLSRTQLQEVLRNRGRAGASREWVERLWSVLSLECWSRHFLSGVGGHRLLGV